MKSVATRFAAVSLVTAFALAFGGCSTGALRAPAEQQGRSVGVTKGPELVFDQPLDVVMPALAGATPTGQNGRVGGELVFWSYRLQDGRDVLFHACAELSGVDCAARAQLVCPAGVPRALETGRTDGDVRDLQCRAIGQAAPGDLRPNCLDSEFSSPLVLGLVSCP